MKIERHGHVVPLPGGFRARCGGPILCRVCGREAAYEDGRRVAHKLLRECRRRESVPFDDVLELLTTAYMEGREVR